MVNSSVALGKFFLGVILSRKVFGTHHYEDSGSILGLLGTLGKNIRKSPKSKELSISWSDSFGWGFGEKVRQDLQTWAKFKVTC